MSDTGDTGARTVLAIGGSDREGFLQGLVSNDVAKLAQGPVYAALLTPQGKYLADFFLAADGARILLDAPAALAQGLAQRLAMYRLRADVTVEATELAVARGLGPPPEGGFADPRHPGLGWRWIGPADAAAAIDASAGVDWDAIRVEHAVPAAGIELSPNDSYILEMGFERLHGVDFRKGCYVGQEVTARMKHKTELKKGLARVALDGAAEPGTEITRDGRPVGTLHTVAGDTALAYLRRDRAGPGLRAGSAALTLLD